MQRKGDLLGTDSRTNLPTPSKISRTPNKISPTNDAKLFTRFAEREKTEEKIWDTAAKREATSSYMDFKRSCMAVVKAIAAAGERARLSGAGGDVDGDSLQSVWLRETRIMMFGICRSQ
jgi:hypothetical protein